MAYLLTSVRQDGPICAEDVLFAGNVYSDLAGAMLAALAQAQEVWAEENQPGRLLELLWVDRASTSIPVKCWHVFCPGIKMEFLIRRYTC